MFKLFQTQEDYLANLGNKPFMFGEPGVGKTAMALNWAHRKGAKKLLIITPASVRDQGQWELEVERFGLEFDVVEVRSHAWLQKYRTYNMADYADYHLILDEAHRIANSQSKQGLGGYQFTLVVEDYVLLSGTPMSKWAMAVNYAKITGLVKNKTEFYRRFVVEQKAYSHAGMDIVGYRNVPELESWWNAIALRGKSEDFVELPSKHLIDVEIPVKRKGYIDMIKTRMKDGEALDSAPKMNWALRAFAETAPEKIRWTVEKIEDSPNCLVFVNTISAMETLSEALTKAKIKHGMYYGARKDKFEDNNVMLVQYQSGGTGLNLQQFSTTIFLSPCYSFIDFEQAIARTWRTGATERCLFYKLSATNTIDKSIYQALDEKKDFDANLSYEE